MYSRNNHYFSSNRKTVYTRNERKRKVSLQRIQGILEHEIEACQIIIVSRRYLSRVHGDESPILLTLTLLDRRAKWPQRIPFSRSTVVTFGGPKFLTLQITSTRKRKSAVYFVCGQSGTSPSLLLDADEARLKDSSNPFPTLDPLDFIAPIIISVQTKTASLSPLRISKIKIVSLVLYLFFHFINICTDCNNKTCLECLIKIFTCFYMFGCIFMYFYVLINKYHNFS